MLLCVAVSLYVSSPLLLGLLSDGSWIFELLNELVAGSLGSKGEATQLPSSAMARTKVLGATSGAELGQQDKATSCHSWLVDNGLIEREKSSEVEQLQAELAHERSRRSGLEGELSCLRAAVSPSQSSFLPAST